MSNKQEILLQFTNSLEKLKKSLYSETLSDTTRNVFNFAYVYFEYSNINFIDVVKKMDETIKKWHNIIY